jgi:hypothetical protein
LGGIYQPPNPPELLVHARAASSAAAAAAASNLTKRDYVVTNQKLLKVREKTTGLDRSMNLAMFFSYSVYPRTE